MWGINQSQMPTEPNNLMTVAAAAVALSEIERRVQKKIAMAGREAELDVAEFAAFNGESVRWVRRNWSRLPGRIECGSQRCRGIHLATYLDKGLKAAV